MIEIKDMAPPNVERFRSRVLIVAGIAIILAIVGFFVEPDQFYKSYLLAYMFWIGLTVGSLGLLMMQHMSGGAWGVVIRRNCEAATRVFPWMALLFLPLIAGMKTLYIWSQDPSHWTPEQQMIIEPPSQKASAVCLLPFAFCLAVGGVPSGHARSAEVQAAAREPAVQGFAQRPPAG